MSTGAVTDYLPDTPCVARAYCPGCEPDADPSDEILDVRWCESHSPARDGADDEVVIASAYISGSAEAGGDDNRRWCDILHSRLLSRDCRIARDERAYRVTPDRRVSGLGAAPDIPLR